jgi:hypothetical protein
MLFSPTNPMGRSDPPSMNLCVPANTNALQQTADNDVRELSCTSTAVPHACIHLPHTDRIVQTGFSHTIVHCLDAMGMAHSEKFARGSYYSLHAPESAPVALGNGLRICKG